MSPPSILQTCTVVAAAPASAPRSVDQSAALCGRLDAKHEQTSGKAIVTVHEPGLPAIRAPATAKSDGTSHAQSKSDASKSTQSSTTSSTTSTSPQYLSRCIKGIPSQNNAKIVGAQKDMKKLAYSTWKSLKESLDQIRSEEELESVACNIKVTELFNLLHDDLDLDSDNGWPFEVPKKQEEFVKEIKSLPNPGPYPAFDWPADKEFAAWRNRYRAPWMGPADCMSDIQYNIGMYQQYEPRAPPRASQFQHWNIVELVDGSKAAYAIAAFGPHDGQLYAILGLVYVRQSFNEAEHHVTWAEAKAINDLMRISARQLNKNFRKSRAHEDVLRVPRLTAGQSLCFDIPIGVVSLTSDFEARISWCTWSSMGEPKPVIQHTKSFDISTEEGALKLHRLMTARPSRLPCTT